MSQIFVSYLSPDSHAVDPIKTVLRDAGLSVWEEAEPTRDNFGEQLRRGLELTRCVILVWSKAAADSQWTLGGMRQAMRVWSSGRLVLAALDDSPLPIGLRDIKPFHVGGASPSELNQLVEHAKSIVAASGAGGSEGSPATPMGDFAPSGTPALKAPSFAIERSGRAPAVIGALIALLSLGGAAYVFRDDLARWARPATSPAPSAGRAEQQATTSSTTKLPPPTSQQPPTLAAPPSPSPAPVAKLEPHLSAPATVPAPSQAPASAQPAAASPEEKAKAFIASFDGGECFLIEPLPGATRPHEYQAVGREIEPFRRFDSAYKREVGVEADLTVAPISAAQCPALDLVRLAAPGGQEPPRLTLKSYEVGRGKPLQGTISNLEGRHPYLLLVDNDGVVHRLEATVDASGDSANFDVPLTPDASSVGPMQMLLAIVSDKPIPALDSLRQAPLMPMIGELLAAARAASASVDAGFFKFAEPFESRAKPVENQAKPAENQAESAASWLRAGPSASISLGAFVIGVVIGVFAAGAWAVRSRRIVQPRPVLALGAAPPTGGGAQVFVSYSHQDVGIVDDVVRQIEGMGYPVWIDRGAHGPQRYAAPIVGAIRGSKLVALMCSRNAFASDHVIREIYLAGDFQKPFIAFQLDPSDFPDDILYFISGFPRIPIANVNLEQLQSAIARLVVV